MVRCLVGTDTVIAQGAQLVVFGQRVGTFNWPKTGTFNWPLTTVDGRRFVDSAHFTHDLLPVLARGISQAVSHEVYDTGLDCCIGARWL